MSLNPEAVDSLKKSLARIGQLYPILVCKQHPDVILAGRHRKEAGATVKVEVDVDEIAKRLGISHQATELLIKAHSNVQRMVSEEERRGEIVSLAKELEASGVKKEDVASKVVDLMDGALSRSRIYELIPQEYKNVQRSEAISEAKKPEKYLEDVLAEYGYEQLAINPNIWKKGGLYYTTEELQNMFPSYRNLPRRNAPPEVEVERKEEAQTALRPPPVQGPVTMYTDAQVKLIDLLGKIPVPFESEVKVYRGEKNKEGQELYYQIDVLVAGKLAVEVEGEGSASRDNEERDRFLQKEGYYILHLPNEFIMKFPWIAQNYVAALYELMKKDIDLNDFI